MARNRNENRTQKAPKQTKPTATKTTVTTGPMPTSGQRGFVPNLTPDAVANYDTRFPAGVAYSPGGQPMSQSEADYFNDYISGRISDAMSIGEWQSSGGYRGGSTAGGDMAGQASSSGSTQKMKLKDAKSMGQALRIAGGGSGNITNKERLQIGRQFNAGDDKVIRRLDAVNEKRTSKRKASYALGGNAFNKLTSGDPTLNFGTGAIGQAVRGGMPQMYGNQNSSRGITNPLQVRKGVSVTGLTAKGDIDTREKFLGSGSFNRPQMKATDTGSGTTTGTNTGTQSTGSTGMDNQPMTPQEMADASTIGGMLSGGGAGAMGATRLGRAKSRLRRLGIYGEGTNLLGRGLQYGINLNK